MIAEAAGLVLGFSFNVEFEAVCAGLPVVAEHEVLPHHDAEFVAYLVKLVGLVVAAAPVANHIHVGVAGGFKDAAIICRCYAIGKAVEGDDIGTLGKNGDAVNDELKRAAPLVGMAV